MELGQTDSGSGKIRIAVFDVGSIAAAKRIKSDLTSEKLAFYNAQIQESIEQLREISARPATDKTRWLRSSEESRIKDFQQQNAELRAERFPFTSTLKNVEGYGCVIQPNWTPKPPQTGHAVQRKLDTHSTPNWTLRAQRRGVEVGFYS